MVYAKYIKYSQLLSEQEIIILSKDFIGKKEYIKGKLYLTPNKITTGYDNDDFVKSLFTLVAKGICYKVSRIIKLTIKN